MLRLVSECFLDQCMQGRRGAVRWSAGSALPVPIRARVIPTFHYNVKRDSRNLIQSTENTYHHSSPQNHFLHSKLFSVCFPSSYVNNYTLIYLLVSFCLFSMLFPHLGLLCGNTLSLYDKLCDTNVNCLREFVLYSKL